MHIVAFRDPNKQPVPWRLAAAPQKWLQFREKIPVAEYAKHKDRFAAAKFDANAITDSAVAAQMRYVSRVVISAAR